METKLQQEINDVLKAFPEYWSENRLLKSKVIEDIRSYNENVIESLLKNDLIKETYSIKISSGLIFKVEDFISMLRFKSYWDNSYTKYTNEIGLTSEGKYLKYSTDVVLDFPHKDSTLEGGMTKDDIGKKEIYYHNIIAKEEIDTLLAPKVLVNAKKFDQDGIHDAKCFSGKDNLILKGNNLIALHSLKKRFNGKVKLIYIDPPYNTGGDSFKYNDSFNQSTWLTFMKNRLNVAKDLLSHDGTLLVQCDDNQQAYLKVLMDEIFGSKNFKNMITIKAKVAGVSGSHQGKSLQNNCEYILMYAKQQEEFLIHNPPKKEMELMDFINRAKEEDISWKYVQVLTELGQSEYIGEIKDGTGKTIEMYEHKNSKTVNINKLAKENYNGDLKKAYYENIDKIFDTTNAQSSIRLRVMESMKSDVDITSIKYVPTSGRNKGKLTTLYYKGPKRRLFTWLRDITYKNKDGEIVREENTGNLWDDLQYNNINKEGNVAFSNGKKPEMLIQRIIEMCTNEEDLVLDFFMGSGTTQATAHKMNRQYIGIEQMDYIQEVSVPRLQKVIDGEQAGISKGVDWQGGGSFVYAELYSLNEKFLYNIQTASNTEELEQVIDMMKTSAYLNFKVDLEKVTTNNEIFNTLSLKEQKDVLIQVLDMNQLYLNYSEIEDSQYEISDSVKSFNHSFYQKEGDQDE